MSPFGCFGLTRLIFSMPMVIQRCLSKIRGPSLRLATPRDASGRSGSGRPKLEPGAGFSDRRFAHERAVQIEKSNTMFFSDDFLHKWIIDMD